MLDKWSLVDVLPQLEEEELQLWRIDQKDARGLVDRYSRHLSASEQIVASRRRTGMTRDHFTLGRACLRILLGNSLGPDFSNAEIATGPHGKPQIAAIRGRTISFNIAHSKDTVLIALAHKGSVGVDVEHFDRSTDTMEVAQANFTANETNSLAAIEDPQIHLRTFYRYWTRKEAIAKADGRGLLLPLSSFDVSFESPEPLDSHPVRTNEPSTQESHLYFVSDLDLGNGAAGALAVDSPHPQIRQLIFPLASFS